MVNLMNVSEEECAELIEVLEREQANLLFRTDRPASCRGEGLPRGELDVVRHLLCKARAGVAAPHLLDPSELIQYRLAGYC